jgi:hypothetical protein
MHLGQSDVPWFHRSDLCRQSPFSHSLSDSSIPLPATGLMCKPVAGPILHLLPEHDRPVLCAREADFAAAPSCRHGGMRNNNFRIVHGWSVNSAAIAGFLACHALGELLPWGETSLSIRSLEESCDKHRS